MPLEPDSEGRLPEHIRALLSPAAYDHPVRDVELIQTHISYVLLAGSHAYKLRKPVDLAFLDFRSLEERKRDCLEEVRLNSRTCPSLYYGVLAVNRDGDRYRLGGPGETVDYAVHMRRIDPETVLANLLAAGRVTQEMIGRLIWKIVRFHAEAENGRRAREIGGYATMVENWTSNLEQAQPYIGRTVSAKQFATIQDYALRFMRDERPLFLRREEDGRVREGHGDLRADAIAFDGGSPDGVCIFDCLEFSERYRYADVGLDIAFLAMDVGRRGYKETADTLLSLYTAASGDKTLPLVGSFFQCYRALVRGKVASIVADQVEVPRQQRAAAESEARLHFDLARAYARPNARPQVILVMGLSGSGKSLLAGALAHRTGAVLLSTDIVRKEMAGALPARRPPVAVGTGLYAPEITERVYTEMLAEAESFLNDGRAVVLDGTYLTAALRAPILDLVRRQGVPALVVECQAPEEVIRGRQERRAAEPWTASDATWEVYVGQRQRYEPPDEVPNSQRLALDTTPGLSVGVETVMARLAT